MGCSKQPRIESKHGSTCLFSTIFRLLALVGPPDEAIQQRLGQEGRLSQHVIGDIGLEPGVRGPQSTSNHDLERTNVKKKRSKHIKTSFCKPPNSMKPSENAAFRP